jgi:hypothetical protein
LIRYLYTRERRRLFSKTNAALKYTCRLLLYLIFFERNQAVKTGVFASAGKVGERAKSGAGRRSDPVVIVKLG